MFLVGQLGATINADRSPFDRTLRGVFRDGGRMMRQLGSQMTMALTVPLAGAGALAVKTAADYERLQVQLNTLAGSAEEGAMAFKRLQDFSAGTPFQLNDLIKANNIIVGMGRSMNEAFSDMQMLGDVASATGANIGELAVTFGQAAGEGKLMTRDIREFINRGIPLTKLLAESMGVATNEIFDLASQGKITFDTLLKALQDATTGTGLYANATEEAANTIHGVWSTLKDNTNRLLSEIGNSIVDTFDLKGVMKDLTGQIQIGIDWFNSLSEETRRMAFYVAGLLGAGGPILVAIGTLTAAFAAISWPVVLGVTAFAGAAGAIMSNWDTIVSYFTTGNGAGLWDAIKEGASDIWESLKNLFHSATGLMDTFSASWGGDVVGVITKSVSIISEAVSTIIDSLGLIINLIRGDWSAAWRDFKRVATINIRELDKEMFLGMGSMMQSATAMTNLLTGNFKAAFEQFKFAYGFDNVYSEFRREQQKNQEAVKGVGEAMRVGAGVLKTEAQQMIDDIKGLQEFLNMDFSMSVDTDSEDSKGIDIARPFIEAQKAVDELIPSLDMVQQKMGELSSDQILADLGNLDLGEMIFPESSMGGLEKRLSELKYQIQAAVPGTERFNLLKDKISEVNSEIFSLRTQMVTTGDILQNFAFSLGEAFSQAVLHSKSLLESLKNIGKQLASKAFITGLRFLLPGGPIFGKASFFGTLFGGFRANGGDVFAGQAYRVGEMNQPEMFIPSTNGSVQPISQGGGTKKVHLQISGQFTQNGSDLRAVINESQFIDL